ncbi:DUF6286 domain-containing protein [Nonomuraea sp. NPDC004354]
MTLPALPEEEGWPTVPHPAAPGAQPVPPPYPAADRAARHAFRSCRTIPASLAALALAAVGFVAAVEIVTTLTGRPVSWLPQGVLLSWATTTRWDQPAVLAGAAVLVLVGLVLLVLALRGGRVRTVPVHTGDPDLVIGLRPRGFAAALARAAEDVPGVHSAKATVRRGSVTVVARASGWDDARLSEAVLHAVTARIEALDPVADHRVSVSMKERR